MDASVLYPRSPSIWSTPELVPDLPGAEITMYPASPGLWQGQVEARATRLRELATGGDVEAAKALRELPGQVIGALAGNPHASDDSAVLDWLARRFPESNG